MSTMPPIRRALKNVVHNYTDAQIKVREATSNDAWGPSGSLMMEIADLTYNVVAFTEIMQMVWKRLNDHGKNWRHVYKSLVLLDYIIKTGTEKVAQQCKENIYAIQTLKDFQYIEDNRDQGMNVREKAKQLFSLLKDDERLKNERAKAMKAKERFAQNAIGVGSQAKNTPVAGGPGGGSPTLQQGAGGYADPYGGATGGYSDSSPTSEFESARPSSVGEEELQLQLAIAMSREEHEEEQKKVKTDDIKLQMAIDESQKRGKGEAESPSNHSAGAGLMQLMDTPIQPPPWSGQRHQQSHSSPPHVDPWSVQPDAAAHGTAAWTTPILAPPAVPPHATSSQTTDPWGVPMVAPVRNSTPVNLPPASGAQAADPWSVPSPQSSPWAAPAPTMTSSQPLAASPGFDAFGAPPAAPTTNGTGGATLDDAFDLLSSRGASPPAIKAHSAVDTFDPLGGTTNGTADTFSMNRMDNALPDKSKKAENFLGDNAGLVNLDELVTPSQKKVTNPFSGTNMNPFEAQNVARVPMNQISSNTGFSQATSASLLPQPLMPLNNAATMQQQQQQQTPYQQNYNPFL